MAFETFADFIHMNGHGIYVWSAFIISIMLFKLLLWLPLMQHRQLLKKLHKKMIREKNRHANERH